MLDIFSPGQRRALYLAIFEHRYRGGQVFYTRPNLPRLGLDLAEIRGGGRSPAQFWGRTVDGRPVYIRYRGGNFSVSCGEVDADEDMTTEVLIDAKIGPFLHGDMLLEQACDLAGMTLHGERMVLLDKQLHAARSNARILDWSGRTTYWERILWVTTEAGRDAVEALARAFPEFYLVGLWWERAENGTSRRHCRPYNEALSHSHAYVTWAFCRDKDRLSARLSDSDELPDELTSAVAHSVDFVFGSDDTPPTTAHPGDLEPPRRGLFIGDYGLLGRFWASFVTGEVSDKVFIEKVLGVVDPYFSNQVETVDLATGEVTNTVTHWKWYSIDLREWCRAEPDRYLSRFKERTGDTVRHLGVRPAITSR
jgi:hypothetical protein